MDKNLLKQVILHQNTIKLKEDTIQRENFSKIESLNKDNSIIIITGIRRCGKSTLLQQIRNNNKEKDYYLNFDDERLLNFTVEDFNMLQETFYELFGKQNTYYFDEIQNIPQWERFVRRLYEENAKIYITGSNASMLSKELGTHLTGRYIETTLYPFSFREFLTFENIKYDKNKIYEKESRAKIRKSFDKYSQKGGFPQYLRNNEDEYLKTLYTNIAYRDVIVRYKLNNEKTIKELIYYTISNVGKKLSYRNLQKILNLGSPTTVKEYISYFENSFIIFTLPKYEFSLKKQIYSNKKIYTIDTGFANTISFKFSENQGRILENLVFIELKRKNQEIYYHEDKAECDFVILKKGKVTSAIQITASLQDPHTKQREYSGLLETLKKYKLKEGLILTLDEEREEIVENKKIIIKPLWKWLLENPFYKA